MYMYIHLFMCIFLFSLLSSKKKVRHSDLLYFIFCSGCWMSLDFCARFIQRIHEKYLQHTCFINVLNYFFEMLIADIV